MSILYFLESIRIPGLNELMLLITRLGEETAFLVLALIVFWCVDKYQGYYLLGVGMLGNLANQFLKITCRVPRPWVRDPEFTVLGNAKEAATGYSFPSGHTQSITGSMGCLARASKRNSVRAVCVLLIALTAFSRMYLGVHTPADVLVGAAMAIVLVIGLRNPVLARKEKNMKVLIAAMLAVSVGFLLYVPVFRSLPIC